MKAQTLHLGRIGLVLAAFVLAALALLVLFLTTAASPVVTPARADGPGLNTKDWIIAIGNTGTVNIIDTATDIVYGPFLQGQLGSEGGGLFDVAITPGGSMALISNFGDSAVYFVDVSNPINPSVVASVTTPMFAEDIAISHDGRFALVTDGGFSTRIAVIDLISRTLAYTVSMMYSDTTDYAQAIDIAPNGTVVAVSYWPGALLSLYPDDTGLLTVTGRYTYTLTSEGIISETGSTSGLDYHIPIEAADGPGATGLEGQEIRAADVHMSGFVNVAVAPDGQTVLVCDVNPYNDIDPSDPDQISYYAVGVYRIIAPGVVTFTGVVSGLERATQSIAFSTNGTKAYLAGNGGGGDPSMGVYRYNHLSVLNIDGPGVVSLDKVNVVEYPRLVSSQLFGVDTIAVVNGKAYLGYPTLGGASYDLQVVNLSDYSVKRLDMPSITTGVGVISPKRVYLPFVVKSMP